jgi:DNA-directed RNA polymerase specialized sigma24 family protein
MVIPGTCSEDSASGDLFATTHWSVVLAAGESKCPASDRALEELCEIYHYPIYAFVRRQGCSDADAKDLTQGFFADFLARDSFANVDRSKGRFRAFLLACVKHYLSRERIRDRALKRGQGIRPIDLDALQAEERYKLEPTDDMSPDRLYDRRCAITLIEQARVRLRAEFVAQKELDRFNVLDLVAQHQMPYAQAIEQLRQPEGTVKSDVLRLRRRLGELVREQIAQTVSTKSRIDAELRYLMATFSDG